MRINPAPEESLLQGDSILDAMAAHLAILDRQGVIIRTNRAWQEFGRENQLAAAPESVGINYLDICDRATGQSAEKAGEVAGGIRAVISGSLPEFTTVYPCHNPREQRWYYLRVVPLDREIPTRVILSHENITPLVEAKEELQHRTTQLEERNITLRVLLEQRQQDRGELEESMVLNMRREVLPYLERLVETLPKGEAANLAALAIQRLLDIVNPMLARLGNAGIILTAQETRTAQMIRDGKTTKEIAELLHISPETVQFHRKNIRRKLGMRKRGESLRAFLLHQTKR